MIAPLSMILGITALFIVSTFIATSVYHHNQVKKYLLKEIPLSKQIVNDAKYFFGLETIPVAGIALFDVIYNTSRLDPNVLKGIVHLHNKREFSNLGELMDYINSINAQVHTYKGHAGEQVAFENLKKSGADVTMPISGTNKGFDLIADGTKLDVKTTADESYINQELARDPEKIIYTNNEMAPYFENNDRVIIDQNLSETDMFNLTNLTLDGINDMGNCIDSIPVITLVISLGKNSWKVVKKEKDVLTAGEHTLLDGLGVGVGGMGGAKLGLLLGFAFAPVTGGTTAILIPAATTTLGTILGVITGKGITNYIKERHLRRALKELVDLALEYKDLYLTKFDTIISDITDYYNTTIKENIAMKNKLQNWFMRAFFPSISVKYYSLAVKKLKIENNNTISFYSELKAMIVNTGENEGGILLFNQGKEILLVYTDLIEAYEKVEHQYHEVMKEEQKLK